MFAIPAGQAQDRALQGPDSGGHGWRCWRWCWPPAVSSVRGAGPPEEAVPGAMGGWRERKKAGQQRRCGVRRERWQWGGPGTVGLCGRRGACDLGQGEEGCGGEGPLPRAETGRGVGGQGPGCPLENSPSSAWGSREGLSAGAGGQGQNHAPQLPGHGAGAGLRRGLADTREAPGGGGSRRWRRGKQTRHTGRLGV